MTIIIPIKVRKEEGGRRKEEGGRRKEEGGVFNSTGTNLASDDSCKKNSSELPAPKIVNDEIIFVPFNNT